MAIGRCSASDAEAPTYCVLGPRTLASLVTAVLLLTRAWRSVRGMQAIFQGTLQKTRLHRHRQLAQSTAEAPLKSFPDSFPDRWVIVGDSGVSMKGLLK